MEGRGIKFNKKETKIFVCGVLNKKKTKTKIRSEEIEEVEN